MRRTGGRQQSPPWASYCASTSRRPCRRGQPGSRGCVTGVSPATPDRHHRLRAPGQKAGDRDHPIRYPDPTALTVSVPCCGASRYNSGAMTKQDLAKWALELPAEDRVELGEALLSSVLPPLTEATKTEIARRSRELQENPQLALSEEEFWNEVNRLATA